MDLTGPDILCNATNLPNFVLMVNTFRLELSFESGYCVVNDLSG